MKKKHLELKCVNCNTTKNLVPISDYVWPVKFVCKDCEPYVISPKSLPVSYRRH